MNEKMIEAIVASPPDRDELVVQLFSKSNGQWGEVYQQDGIWWIDMYQQSSGQPWQFKVEEVISVLSLSLAELQKRLAAQE
jgi:hypothetical protein